MFGHHVFSNDKDCGPSSRFFGYAFVGSNFIYGSTGALDYEATHGTPIEGGHDGCYLSVRRVSDQIIFDTDYSGFQPLYYYRNGHEWAVSGSWIKLVEHLRSREFPIKVNHAALQAVGQRISMEQLSTYETPVHGIHLLPLHHQLVAQGDQLRVCPRPPITGSSMTYGEALEGAMATWVGRLQTLLTHSKPLHLRIELSGGRDSRATFGIYLAARRMLNQEGIDELNSPYISSNTAPRAEPDLRVAQALAQRFGSSLNPDITARNNRLSPQNQYNLWRNTHLGAYHPIYFPTHDISGDLITLGGNAAGNHRDVYQTAFRARSVRKFTLSHTKAIPSLVHGPEYREALYRTFKEFPEHLTEDEKIGEHYRQFRGRLHGSVNTHNRVTMFPFGSFGFDQARRLGGQGRFNSAQINYDMMNMLEPELLSIPYDKPEKAPSQENWEVLLRGPITSAKARGSVYGDISTSLLDEEPTQREGSSLNSTRLPQIVSEELQQALSDPYVQALLPGQIAEEALKESANFSESGRFTSARAAKHIAVCLTAHAISPNYTPSAE